MLVAKQLVVALGASSIVQIALSAREEQEEYGAPEPFGSVRESIQNELASAAQNLVQSSEEQARITQNVANHIGSYKSHVKKIASTMGEVLKARNTLTDAYHEDIKEGEEKRMGALEVDIPQLYADNVGEFPHGGAFSEPLASDEVPPTVNEPQIQPQQHQAAEELPAGHELHVAPPIGEDVPPEREQEDASTQDFLHTGESREHNEDFDLSEQQQAVNAPGDLDEDEPSSLASLNEAAEPVEQSAVELGMPTADRNSKKAQEVGDQAESEQQGDTAEPVPQQSSFIEVESGSDKASRSKSHHHMKHQHQHRQHHNGNEVSEMNPSELEAAAAARRKEAASLEAEAHRERQQMRHAGAGHKREHSSEHHRHKNAHVQMQRPHHQARLPEESLLHRSRKHLHDRPHHHYRNSAVAVQPRSFVEVRDDAPQWED